MTAPRNPGALEAGDPLPGLGEPAGTAGPLELAAHRTLAALEADGLLTEQHALIAQLILDLARVATLSVRTGKASAAALAGAQLLAAYDVLTPDTAEGGHDAYDQLAADLRAAAVDETRRATAVRDRAEP